MTTINIEHDVPVPGANQNAKYPFNEMNVGDSFEIAIQSRHTAAAIGTYARKFGNKQQPPRSFTVRTNKERNTVRVWRIS